MRRFIEKIPIPIAGLALGLVALGNLLQGVSPILRVGFALLSAAAMSLLIARILLYPRSVGEELRSNSIFGSVFATSFMAAMQLASIAYSILPALMTILWFMAIAGHLTLIVWFTFTRIRNFKLEDVFPTYFIAYVGIIVASVTAPTFHMQALGILLFWFGFACYLIMFALVTVRYLRIPVAQPARPLFCVYAAPMSLSLTGYLSSYANPNLIFATVLAILAQILLLSVVLRLPSLVRMDFYPSFAAMTFPFVISATGLAKVLPLLALPAGAITAIAQTLSGAEIVLATVMVCFVLARYVIFFFDVAKDCITVASTS